MKDIDELIARYTLKRYIAMDSPPSLSLENAHRHEEMIFGAAQWRCAYAWWRWGEEQMARIAVEAWAGLR